MAQRDNASLPVEINLEKYDTVKIVYQSTMASVGILKLKV